MRRSILQSKRSQNFKLFFPIISMFLATTSCEIVESKGVLDELPKKNTIVYLDQNETQFVLANRSNCPNHPKDILFDFASPFGHHKGQLKFGDLTHPDTFIEIEGQSFNIGNWELFDNEQSQDLCRQFSKGQSPIRVVSGNLGDRFLRKLEEVSPMCTFAYTSQGLSCTMKQTTQAEGQAKIESIEKELFRFRQRHPYVLARRIAIARQLLEAQTSAIQINREDICNLASLSQESELPLPMRSSIWLESCQQQTTDSQTKFLQVSFAEAIDEIEFLLLAFRKTNTGVLTLRLPTEDIQNRDFWVKLTPEKLEEQPTGDPSCYWHPLHQDIAKKSIYTTIHSQFDRKCASPSPQVAEIFTHTVRSYISQSICSETEFPITNGRGKILALPAGDYHYEIKVNHAPFAAPLVNEKPPHLSSGTIEWKSKRPFPVIGKM